MFALMISLPFTELEPIRNIKTAFICCQHLLTLVSVRITFESNRSRDNVSIKSRTFIHQHNNDDWNWFGQWVPCFRIVLEFNLLLEQWLLLLSNWEIENYYQQNLSVRCIMDLFSNSFNLPQNKFAIISNFHSSENKRIQTPLIHLDLRNFRDPNRSAKAYHWMLIIKFNIWEWLDSSIKTRMISTNRIKGDAGNTRTSNWMIEWIEWMKHIQFDEFHRRYWATHQDQSNISTIEWTIWSYSNFNFVMKWKRLVSELI